MFQEFQAFQKKYEKIKHLSGGAQGVTWLCKENPTGKMVVVKAPNKPSDLSDWTSLANKTHPNIVRVYECFHNEMATMIVMEFCQGGDLFGAIESMTGQLSQNWCAKVMIQVLQGVKYLHTQFGESHNDIKPENILMDRKCTTKKEVPRPMIGDFGCLAPFYSITIPKGGDPRYRAPEIYQGAQYGPPSDIWAFGVTLYELCSGGLLIHLNEPNRSGWANFKKAENGHLQRRFEAHMKKGTPVDVSYFTTSRLPALLSRLLEVDPSARATIDEAEQHPWFQLAQANNEEPLPQDTKLNLTQRSRNHRLHQALLDMVGRKLQGQSLDYYSEIWRRYDTDGDGVMAYPEFAAMMDDLGAGGDAPHVFSIADRNGQGTINFNEFVALMFDSDKLDEEEKRQYFNSVFVDIGGDDGVIVFDDLAAAFPGVNQYEVAQLFRDMDADGNGYVTISEFIDYIDDL